MLEPVGKHDWEQVEVGPRRVLPALPTEDADLGEIRWGRWERSLLLTHIDPSCESCGYAGPLADARGMTLHQDPPRRRLLERSKIAEGKRPVWGPAITPAPRWIYTHWASRCQACDEMVVWCMTGQRTRCQECAGVVDAKLKGTRGQCPLCLRAARFVVPGGTIGHTDTWVELAYNPPRVEQVPPSTVPPQADSLF